MLRPTRLLPGLIFLLAVPLLPAAVHRVGPELARLDGTEARLAPGDEIVLAAGTRGALRLQNLHGTAERPVIIRPEGELGFTGGKDYAIKLVDSTHFVLTGRPAPGAEGVLRINGGENSVVVTGFSSDFTVEALFIEHSGFAGLMVKLDPTEDPRTWRDAFTMRNVTIRDCVVRHAGGEGLYIGNSFFTAGHLTAAKIRRPPHAIVGLRVENNRTTDTGCEGIQVGCATGETVIAGNTIEQFGQRPFGPYQDNGLQLGEGTVAVVRDNVIRHGPGHGLIVLGPGGNEITGNRIEHAGGNGIYAQATPADSAAPGHRITGNTIVAPDREAVVLRGTRLEPGLIAKNRFIATTCEPAVLLHEGARAEVRDNEEHQREP